jgi:hypothetical protein
MLSWGFKHKVCNTTFNQKHTVSRIFFPSYWFLHVVYLLLVPVGIHTDRNLKYKKAQLSN